MAQISQPQLLVILGPTASGKSALAMAIARRTGAEILSVDSMQVYRGLDIGTAKPSAAERAEVRHHGLDLASPTESFSVARFVEFADDVIGDAAARNVPLIATGGTPLYFKALFEGLFDGPSADPGVRERLGLLTNEELHQRLTTVDPAAGARIHLRDTRRLIRALEVYEATGRPISSLQTEWAAGVARHAAVWIGLHWDRDVLNRRINARVKAMVAAGWVDEARVLLDSGQPLSRTAAEATGYSELFEHLAGRLPLDEAIERIKMATRQLARRQMKWFRRFPNVHWLPGEAPLEANVKAAMELWHGTAGEPKL
jgi:tRNA dimethylallyltransferase